MIEFERKNGKKFKIDYLDIYWNSDTIGFGHLTLAYDKKTKKWATRTECMGKGFAEKLLDACATEIKNNIEIEE